ncbi:MAG: phosphonate transport system substrate-binding protein [Pseudoalteromonas tetraodonis]|jgi:phosphonate transport system substrate-binding protein
MKRRTLLTAAVTAVVLSSCGGKKEDSAAVLTFSAIPDQNKAEIKAGFEKIAKHLSKELGVKVEYSPSSDYGASVESFAQGDIQLAWFGGLTGVQARAKVEGAHAIAQGKADPQYYSYFIAHKDSGLERSDKFPDIAGKSFTFGSESSTSGRLMPEFFIREETDKSPEEFLGAKPAFSGSHDATAEAVESGKVQVGALSYKAYDKLVAAGKIDPEVCKIIWKTPFYADYNWTAHPDLEKTFGDGFTEKVKKALLELPKDLLAVFPREGMIEANDEDFQGIVDVAKGLGFVK